MVLVITLMLLLITNDSDLHSLTDGLGMDADKLIELISIRIQVRELSRQVNFY